MKSGFVAIIGRSNVGKSTVLNNIVGEKIAITANKPQTTRNSITGIYNDKDSQIIFIDTPGIHKAKNALSRKMVNIAFNTPKKADIILFIIDSPFQKNGLDNLILENIKRSKQKKILLINKIDKFKKNYLLNTYKYFENLQQNNKKVFAEVLTSRADKNLGIKELINELKEFLTDNKKYFPDGMKNENSEEFFIAEIIREKVIRILREEIPHGIYIEIKKIIEEKNTKELLLKIFANIIIEKKQHRKIILGKDGSMIKRIGTYAREDLEKFFMSKVYLELFVKVKENWRNKV
ncbi:MAG: GTPase Era [Clostridiales Family XIII bacterium]|jgi:GTP-binding protein Era|nr:GTPase Era [Clostridiales Family XIII bacterium]